MKGVILLIICMAEACHSYGARLQRGDTGNKFYYRIDTAQKAPDFICTTISGKRIETKNMTNKVIVLNFWFIACAPCRKELTSLTKLANSYKRDTNIVFLSVSSMDGKGQLEFVKKRTGFSYQLVASRSDICSMFHINIYPTNLILYKNKVIFKSTGYRPDIDKKLAIVINKTTIK